MSATHHGNDNAWLLWLCASRTSFALVFTAYAAAIPLLRPDWGMSAGEAGMIQSAWHFGYLFSLVVVGFLVDRYGAKRVFIFSSIASKVISCPVCGLDHGVKIDASGVISLKELAIEGEDWGEQI